MTWLKVDLNISLKLPGTGLVRSTVCMKTSQTGILERNPTPLTHSRQTSYNIMCIYSNLTHKNTKQVMPISATSRAMDKASMTMNGAAGTFLDRPEDESGNNGGEKPVRHTASHPWLNSLRVCVCARVHMRVCVCVCMCVCFTIHSCSWCLCFNCTCCSK